MESHRRVLAGASGYLKCSFTSSLFVASRSRILDNNDPVMMAPRTARKAVVCRQCKLLKLLLLMYELVHN